MSSRFRTPRLDVGDAFVASMADEPPHLWIVVSQDPHSVVIVNLTTLRKRADTSAVFTRGEHPFIKHDSCAYFQGMQESTAEKVLKLENAGIFRRVSRVSPAVLDKLHLGALRSRFTPLKLRRTFEQIMESRESRMAPPPSTAR